MRRLDAGDTAGHLLTGHRTITDERIGTGILDLPHDGPRDLDGCVTKSLLHAIRAVMPGTALDGGYFGVRNELQAFLGFQADFLNPLMASDVISDLAQGFLKISFKQSRLVTVSQVFKWIKYVF